MCKSNEYSRIISKMVRIVFSAYFLLYIGAINATIFSHIKLAKNSAQQLGRTIYDFSIDVWTTESDSQPNPCYGEKCSLGVNHRHASDDTGGNAQTGVSSVDISEAKTVGDVRNIWENAHPLPLTGSTYHDGSLNAPECVGLFYTVNNVSRLFPNSSCGLAPPPSGSCSYNTNVLNLNYGSVSPYELNGRQVSATVTLSCSVAMNIEAWLINPDDGSDMVKLRSDGSLSARLTLDGQNASTSGEILSVSPEASVPLTVTSEAVVSGIPEAGNFSGSAILFITLP